MFYIFSKEFGWTIDEISNCDIYQLELYFDEMDEAVKRQEKRHRDLSGKASHLSQNKLNINNYNDFMKFSNKTGSMILNDKRKKK